MIAVQCDACGNPIPHTSVVWEIIAYKTTPSGVLKPTGMVAAQKTLHVCPECITKDSLLRAHVTLEAMAEEPIRYVPLEEVAQALRQKQQSTTGKYIYRGNVGPDPNNLPNPPGADWPCNRKP